VFCETFTNDDRVRLVLKVHYKDYSEDNKEYCRTKINNITSEYSNAPVIEYILDNITDSEISGLHAAGDCYVSLTKSEGFGLTLYDAYKYGKKIIVTGYGGHVDFLGKNYQGFVKYTLENILSEDEMYPYYTKEQKWAYPDLTHVKTLLKESYQQNYNQ
jgi:glycosyltransferase involved in cell wall biosynthesis